VPQLGLEQSSAFSKSPLALGKVNQIPFLVPPRENLHVTMKFETPAPPDEVGRCRLTLSNPH